MQEVVVFKLDVLDERNKHKALKVVSEFPGVTSVDVKEKGKLKVTGKFDKFVMTKKLKKIYEYVDIIAVGPDGKPGENRSPVKKPVQKVNKPTNPKKVTKPSTTNPRQKKGQAQNSATCLIM